MTKCHATECTHSARHMRQIIYSIFYTIKILIFVDVLIVFANLRFFFWVSSVASVLIDDFLSLNQNINRFSMYVQIFYSIIRDFTNLTN